MKERGRSAGSGLECGGMTSAVVEEVGEVVVDLEEELQPVRSVAERERAMRGEVKRVEATVFRREWGMG